MSIELKAPSGYLPFEPAGDQPEAIAKLIEGIGDGLSYQTARRDRVSKTFTMSNGAPGRRDRDGRQQAAAQLYSELRVLSR
jgi:excinuclease ABC subunit B